MDARVFLALLVVTLSFTCITAQAPGCSQNFSAVDDIIGLIDSPNYPSNYPPRSQCIYTIFLANPTDLFDIFLHVSNFRTYSRDYVYLNNRRYSGDGSQTRAALQTGQTYVYHYRESMVIRFAASSGRTAQGFSLTYVVEPTDGTSTGTEACNSISCMNGGTCHSHVNGEKKWRCYCLSGYVGDRCENIPNTHDCPKHYNRDGSGVGEIRSTYYPSFYPSRHYCDMYIVNVTRGDTVAIYVEDFITERGYDVLCINSVTPQTCYSGDGRTSSGALRVGQTYYYSVEDAPFRLLFSTDASRTYRGFRLGYVVIEQNTELNITTVGRTNKGTEFTFAFIPHRLNTVGGTTTMSITSEFSATVDVEIPFLNSINNYTVSPLQPLLINLDNRIRTTDGLENKGITVRASNNVTVAAYSSSGSASDGMLILPEAHLGTQHVVASYQPYTDSYSVVTVVGNENLTTVWFVQRNNSINDGDGGYDYDNALRVEVYDKQTYTFKSRTDLTGMKVVSNRPISVISGCDYAQIPNNIQYGDQLVEMIPSIISLGYEFMIVPISERIGGEVVRVISWTDDTIVRLPQSGFQTEIDEGEFTEITATSGSASYIECSHKCLVVQYNKGGSRDNQLTDPFMQIIPPIAQYTQNQIFMIPEGYRDYVNIVIKTKWVGGLSLSGQNVSEMGTWHTIPNSNYSMMQLGPIASARDEFLLSHELGERAEWSAILYGHASSRSERRGYGYPLGMQLEVIEERATEPPKITDPPATEGPIGNYTQGCRCNFRIIGNETAGEPEYGTLVHDLPDIQYFSPYDNCEFCLTTVQNCPVDCRSAVLNQWGTAGLASEIRIDTSRGPRLKALGQVMCERHYTPIQPPGRKLSVFYRAGTCNPTRQDMPILIGKISAGPYLCCTEVEVPIVGAIPAWDIDCTGENLLGKSEKMLKDFEETLRDKGLTDKEIKDAMKNLGKQ